MKPAQQSILYVTIGLVFMVSALVSAFSSVSLRVFGFGLPSLRYNPYLELLAFVSVGLGGFFMFRAGQIKPANKIPSKSLIEQVRQVSET